MSRTSRTVFSRLRSSRTMPTADSDLDDKDLYLGDLVLVLAVFVVEDLADGVLEVGVIEDEDRVIDNEVLDVEDLMDNILHVDEIIFYNSYYVHYRQSTDLVSPATCGIAYGIARTGFFKPQTYSSWLCSFRIP